jgi:hypothetical protein
MNMWQVIARGAQGPAGRPAARCCPFCGVHPPLAIRRAGHFLIGCEEEDCAARPQVAAPSLEAAWAAWNRRA